MREEDKSVIAYGESSSIDCGTALADNPKNNNRAAEALNEADVCIALSQSGPGVIKPEWVATMAADAIVFACANPVPEI